MIESMLPFGGGGTLQALSNLEQVEVENLWWKFQEPETREDGKSRVRGLSQAWEARGETVMEAAAEVVEVIQKGGEGSMEYDIDFPTLRGDELRKKERVNIAKKIK